LMTGMLFLARNCCIKSDVWLGALTHWHVSSSNRRTESHEWIRERCQLLVPTPRWSFFDHIESVVALFQSFLRFGNSRNFLTALCILRLGSGYLRQLYKLCTQIQYIFPWQHASSVTPEYPIHETSANWKPLHSGAMEPLHHHT
jgi:hypothetical protein